MAATPAVASLRNGSTDLLLSENWKSTHVIRWIAAGPITFGSDLAVMLCPPRKHRSANLNGSAFAD